MKQIRTLKDILSRFFGLLTKEQKNKSYILLFMMIISAMFETLGVSSVIPFVNALLSPESLKKNKVMYFFIQYFHITSNIGIIILTAFFIILVYFAKDAYLSFYAYFKNKYEKTLQEELSVKSFRSYLMRPYSYYLNVNSSEVLRGIESDILSTTDLYGHINLAFSTSFSVLLISIYLLYTDWILAIGIVFVGGVCAIGLMRFFKKKMRGVGAQNREAQYETNKYALQAIEGIKEISVMKRMDVFLDKYEDAYERRKKTQIKFNFLNALPNRVIEFSCMSGMMIVICLKMAFMSNNGGDNIAFVAGLSAFVLGAFKILPSIGTIISEVNSISYCRPFLNSCYENIRSLEKDQQEAGIQSIEVKEKTKEHFEKSVYVDHISWHYPSSDRQILDGLTLTIRKGDSIGIIGESGAGKTTLSDILLGLYHPQQGTVLVDGTDIFTIPKSWAGIIGYVSQTVYLLDDTLRNNVLFGLSEADDSDERIWEALEQAQLASFARELPDQLDTMVGERGIKFSGGQRQRVAIARALYTHPEILVLDEATSALDNGTESAVMDAIDNLHRMITLVIIAHRLSTISKCDRVYEIKDGHAILQDKQEQSSK